MPVLRESTVAQREAKFVAVYATNFNAREAAEAAGYKTKNAEIQGYQLLARPSVQALLRERVERVALRHEITLDKVIAELGRVGFSNMTHYTRLGDDGLRMIDFSAATEDQMAAVQSIEVVERTHEDADGGAETTRTTKVRLHDKITPLVTLGKHLGMGVDKSGENDRANISVEFTLKIGDMNSLPGDTAKVIVQG